MTFLRRFAALLALVALAVAVDELGVAMGFQHSNGAAVVLLCATLAIIIRGPR